MNDLGRVGVIVAARMGSTRFPGKALKPLHGMPMLAFLLRRIRSSNSADEIVLCTSVRTDDTVLAELANTEGVGVYRGALDDVTDRYVSTAREYKIDTVVRITGDCPFVDGELIDHCVSVAAHSNFDLCTSKGEFSQGLDVEIYRNAVMMELHKGRKLTREHREHLTLYFYQHRDRYSVVEITPRTDWLGKGRIYTVDTIEDYVEAASLVEYFDTPFFSISDLIALERRGDVSSKECI